MLNKEKAVIYLRVSTKEQEKDGYSLEVQEKTSLKYAQNNNLKIVRIWKCSESAWGIRGWNLYDLLGKTSLTLTHIKQVKKYQELKAKYNYI